MAMKDVELRLVSELMKNSRRSDRELAKAIGVSQPTVSRAIKRLERQGYIREYTIIPDYRKIGYHIAAFTLVKLKGGLSPDEVENVKQLTLEDMKRGYPEVVLFERGLGSPYTGIFVSFHRDYSSYTKMRERIRSLSYIDFSATQSFLLDLEDKIHYRYITFATLANHLLEMNEQKE